MKKQYSVSIIIFILLIQNIIAQEKLKPVSPEVFDLESSSFRNIPAVEIETSTFFLHEGDEYYTVAKYDSALMMYQKGLILAIEKNEKNSIVKLYSNIGSVYDNFGMYDKARVNVLKAVSHALDYHDIGGLGTALNLLGSVFFRYGDYQSALQSFYYALFIKQKSGELLGTSSVLNNIANIYYTWGDYQQSRNLQLKSYKILLSLKDSVELSGVMLNLGNSYLSLNNIDSALYFYDAAIELSLLQENDLRVLGGMNNKAYLLISSGLYDEALEMLNQAYNIAEKKNYNMEFMYIQRNLGEVFLKKGEYDKSLRYLEKSALMANEAGVVDLYISLLELMAEAYENSGDFKKAYVHFKKAKQFNDSIFNIEMRQNIYSYQNRYEAQMEESQLLMKDLQILRHKSAVRNQFYVFVVILLVLTATGVMLLISRKNKERIKEKSFMQEIVKFQQKALSAQMNPHFVSNSLNSIQRFYLQNDYETATDYLSEFGALIRIILENSSKELICVDEEVKFIRAYLKLEHLRLERKFNYHIHVQSDLNAMQVNIPPLILQPFVENAVWHGLAPLKSEVKPQLFINFMKDGEFLVIEVDDEGIGIDASQEMKQRFKSGRKSYAMEINSKRLQLFETLINEKIVLTVFDKKQINQHGTKVIFRIPLKFTIFTA